MQLDKLARLGQYRATVDGTEYTIRRQPCAPRRRQWVLEANGIVLTRLGSIRAVKRYLRSIAPR